MDFRPYPNSDPAPARQQDLNIATESTAAGDLATVVRILGWLLFIGGIASGVISLFTAQAIRGLTGFASGILGYCLIRAGNQLRQSADKREVCPEHLSDALKSIRTYFLIQLLLGALLVVLFVLLIAASQKG